MIQTNLQQTIFDLFNYKSTDVVFKGIFAQIAYLHQTATYYNIINKTGFDDEYIAHSANKKLSPYVTLKSNTTGYTKEYNENPGVKALTTAGVLDLATLIYDRYNERWERLYNAIITTTYNPIENYNSIEKRGSKITTTNTGTDNNTNVYGFNSLNAVPESTQHSTGEVETSGDIDDNVTEKSGNIGVTTSQQMLTAEIELRIKTDFTKILFDCVDEFLTIPSFDEIQSKEILRY